MTELGHIMQEQQKRGVNCLGSKIYIIQLLVALNVNSSRVGVKILFWCMHSVHVVMDAKGRQAILGF